MANKITESISLSIKGTSLSATMGGSVTIDQQGDNYTDETQDVPADVWTQLDIGSSIAEGDLGYLMIRNLTDPDAGAGNDVEIATDNAGANRIAAVKPAKGNFISPPDGTVGLYAKPKIAGTKIAFLAIET